MKKSFNVGDLFAWTLIQGVKVTLDFKDLEGRYEVDGHLFRKGVFRFIWQDGRKVGRQKAEVSVYEIPLTEDSIAGIWLSVRRFGRQEIASRPTIHELISMIQVNKRRLSYDAFENVLK